jgi:hypothetical protein
VRSKARRPVVIRGRLGAERHRRICAEHAQLSRSRKGVERSGVRPLRVAVPQASAYWFVVEVNAIPTLRKVTGGRLAPRVPGRWRKMPGISSPQQPRTSAVLGIPGAEVWTLPVYA